MKSTRSRFASAILTALFIAILAAGYPLPAAVYAQDATDASTSLSTLAAEDEEQLAVLTGTVYVQGAVSSSKSGEFGSKLQLGTMAGGKLSTLALTVSDTALSGSVKYRVNYAGSGWSDAAANGETAGSSKTSSYVQAVRIWFTGKLSQSYDVYYRVYVKGYGWLDWTSNGSTAGTTGLSRSVRAIQIKIVAKGAQAPGDTTTPAINKASLSTTVGLSSSGWLSSVKSGFKAGRTSTSQNMTALKISMDSVVSGSITYRVNYAGVGWQSWAKDGSKAGKLQTSNYVQAIQIKLTGEAASCYDIYYQAYVQGYGWLDWTSNGSTAGTTGLTMRVTAIRVKIVAKGASAPGSTDTPCVRKATLSVRTRLSSSGWLSAVAAGKTSGKTSTSQRLTALRIDMFTPVSGSIKYRVNYSGYGWKSWAKDGATSGSTSTSKYAQAIQVKLTGDAATYYDVYYRVYVQGYGWLDWAANGATAGTTGLELRITAVQVKVVLKGASAPGSTDTTYVKSSDTTTDYSSVITQLKMLSKAQGYSSETQYLILVDRGTNRTAVYSGSKGNWKQVKFWLCTTGKSTTRTPRGVFTIGRRGYSFGSSTYTCYYYTQIYGGILFHSVLYYPGTRTIYDGRLGVNASHGCVRLAISAAKWIYDNIPEDTKVVIYETSV